DGGKGRVRDEGAGEADRVAVRLPCKVRYQDEPGGRAACIEVEELRRQCKNMGVRSPGAGHTGGRERSRQNEQRRDHRPPEPRPPVRPNPLTPSRSVHALPPSALDATAVSVPQVAAPEPP